MPIMPKIVSGVFSVLIAVVFPLFSEEQEPLPSYFYSAEKDGKVLYFLGATSAGVSLEDIDCSSDIKKSLTNSDLVFMEQAPLSLSIEDKKIFFLGSREEKEELIERIPPELALKLSEIKERKENMISYLIPEFVFIGAFENLNFETQEFFMSMGMSPEDSLSDHFTSLWIRQVYESYYSFSENLVQQIGEIATSAGLPIRSVDNDSRIIEDLELHRNERSRLIRTREIDFIVENYNRNLDQTILGFQIEADRYTTGYLQQPPPTYDDFPIDDLFKTRNERWIDKIKQAQAENPEYDSIFSVVEDPRHLVGPFNLLDMLQNEGFFIRHIHCL